MPEAHLDNPAGFRRASSASTGFFGKFGRGLHLETMNTIPPVLLAYIAGLKSHNLEQIALTVADDLAFLTTARTLNKEQFLQMLRALYTGFPEWRYDHDEPEWQGEVIAVKWRQGGTHTHDLRLPGFPPVAATGRVVRIPEHYFFYRVQNEKIIEIRPEPVPGGAPRGIFEQIGVEISPV
jgi:predicted ester cyclase